MGGVWKSVFSCTKSMCNISEMGQDRTKVTSEDRLVPKSTTLDDLEGSSCTLFQNTCAMVRPQAQGSPCA